jgi:hypothetical protein
MSKFNRPGTRSAVSSPVKSEQTPSGRTHEGAPGFGRDVKSELFLRAISNMVGEDTFYEQAKDRDDRYTQLVQHCAVEYPVWTAGLLDWLRNEAHMRSASLVGAAEFVRGRLQYGGDQPLPRKHHTTEGDDSLGYSIATNRRVIASVLRRADEPGELLAYWTSKYGRAIPKPIKRGIEDAIGQLYDEKSLIKYDTGAFRFGDVIDLVHPAPRDQVQGHLFRHAIDRRHGRGEDIPESLVTLGNRAELLSWPVEERRALFDKDQAAFVLKDAGMTWESVAGWLQGPMDAKVWEALIPSMGYMARLRNLRNFDEAGVSDDVAEQVAARLSDPEQVARSRQLPMRFLSAYRAAPSLRWAHALDKALTASIDNIPALKGRTLILVDTSSSMDAGFSKDGTLMRWDAAALFGIALGNRCAQADVVSFSSTARYYGDPHGARTKQFPIRRGESLLRSLDRWKGDGYFLGGGTATAGAVTKHLAGHDRVVILTDEQASGADVDRAVPQTTPLITFNLAGYQRGHAPSGTGLRVAIGGLSDAGFKLLSMLEVGRNADWPWLQDGPAA